tara:strand:+ start:178 stop:540 length:363 start_codon:yes stop_codon:yes gene_type:complete
MAYSVKWLCSDEAANDRYQRLTSVDETYPMITHQYVVHVELNGRMENPERFQEIDADNIEHALTLAKQWVTVHSAASVGIRKVGRDGSLGIPDIYDWSDFMEETIDVVKQWRESNDKNNS